MKIRMYPIDSTACLNGISISRTATKVEVLAYFSHPKKELENFDFWRRETANQRSQLWYAFTSDELKGVHPDHRALFIDCATWKAQPSTAPQQAHLLFTPAGAFPVICHRPQDATVTVDIEEFVEDEALVPAP